MSWGRSDWVLDVDYEDPPGRTSSSSCQPPSPGVGRTSLPRAPTETRESCPPGRHHGNRPGHCARPRAIGRRRQQPRFAATYIGWWEWAARRDPVLARLGLTPDQCGALVALVAGSRRYRHNGKQYSLLAAARMATELGRAVELSPAQRRRLPCSRAPFSSRANRCPKPDQGSCSGCLHDSDGRTYRDLCG